MRIVRFVPFMFGPHTLELVKPKTTCLLEVSIQDSKHSVFLLALTVTKKDLGEIFVVINQGLLVDPKLGDFVFIIAF